MKITIDLADRQFQEAVADAVKEKLHSMAADALEGQLKAAAERVLGDVNRRFDSVIRSMIQEVMTKSRGNPWDQDSIRRTIETQTKLELNNIVAEQFMKRFPMPQAADGQ